MDLVVDVGGVGDFGDVARGLKVGVGGIGDAENVTFGNLSHH